MGLIPLQPDDTAPAVLRKRVHGEEDPLHPTGLASKTDKEDEGLGLWSGGSRQTSAAEGGQRTRGS